MSKPRCETCRHYQPPTHKGARGECRLRPPAVMADANSGWPRVMPLDWCSEHTPGTGGRRE